MKHRKYLFLIFAIIFLLPTARTLAAPLKISEIQNLSFGLVSVGSGGTISTTGAYSGDVMMLGEYQNGMFEVRGTKNSNVTISFLGETNLQQKGYKIHDVDFQVIGGNTINLGSSGLATITIIGSVNVNTGQQEGLYTESYNVHASYSDGDDD